MLYPCLKMQISFGMLSAQKCANTYIYKILPGGSATPGELRNDFVGVPSACPTMKVCKNVRTLATVFLCKFSKSRLCVGCCLPARWQMQELELPCTGTGLTHRQLHVLVDTSHLLKITWHKYLPVHWYFISALISLEVVFSHALAACCEPDRFSLVMWGPVSLESDIFPSLHVSFCSQSSCLILRGQTPVGWSPLQAWETRCSGRAR